MPNSITTVAILPVKKLEDAKQRLSDVMPSGFRRALAEAMYSDVLIALRRAKSVDQVIVVTADRAAARIAEGNGTIVLQDTGSSHSEGAIIGLRRAHEMRVPRALLVPLDCPLLDPAELDELIARRVPRDSALIIPDRHGEGTNGLLLTPPAALIPSFGEGSCQRHVDLATERGSTPEVVEVPTLALDIDTPDDLQTLRDRLETTRGGAAYTRGFLKQLDRSLGPPEQ
jgi:2-phospho-L-lactate/phosphoenolpyruvate guanylyltransferase